MSTKSSGSGSVEDDAVAALNSLLANQVGTTLRLLPDLAVRQSLFAPVRADERDALLRVLGVVPQRVDESVASVLWPWPPQETLVKFCRQEMDVVGAVIRRPDGFGRDLSCEARFRTAGAY